MSSPGTMVTNFVFSQYARTAKLEWLNCLFIHIYATCHKVRQIHCHTTRHKCCDMYETLCCWDRRFKHYLWLLLYRWKKWHTFYTALPHKSQMTHLFQRVHCLNRPEPIHLWWYPGLKNPDHISPTNLNIGSPRWRPVMLIVQCSCSNPTYHQRPILPTWF